MPHTHTQSLVKPTQSLPGDQRVQQPIKQKPSENANRIKKGK